MQSCFPHFRQHGIDLSNGPLVMGVLNVTPDSFSDGGKFLTPNAAVSRTKAMVEEGASIIDIGAESTRPGHKPISIDEEWYRIQPVLEGLAELPTTYSIDTTKAKIAYRSLEALKGRHVIINDVWGLQKDPAMAGVVSGARVPIVIMHNKETVEEGIDIISHILCFFDKSLTIAEKAGVPSENIILDPGIGFGKTLQQNPVILKRLGEIARLGFPILVGASRKRFIGAVLDAVVDKRVNGTLGTHLAAVARGANIIRAHDIKEHVEAIKLWQHISEAPDAA